MHPYPAITSIDTLRMNEYTAVAGSVYTWRPRFLTPLEFDGQRVIFVFFLRRDTAPLLSRDADHSIFNCKYFPGVVVFSALFQKRIPPFQIFTIKKLMFLTTLL